MQAKEIERNPGEHPGRAAGADSRRSSDRSQGGWLASARGSVRVAPSGCRPRTQGRRSHTNSPAYRAQGLHNQRASGEGELLDQHTLIDHRRSRGGPAPCSDVVLQQAWKQLPALISISSSD